MRVRTHVDKMRARVHAKIWTACEGKVLKRPHFRIVQARMWHACHYANVEFCCVRAYVPLRNFLNGLSTNSHASLHVPCTVQAHRCHEKKVRQKKYDIDGLYFNFFC